MPDPGARIEAELRHFASVEIHALPMVFHHWAVQHLQPLLKSVFGQDDTFDIFATHIGASIDRTGNPNILSVGSGDAQVDIAVAERMRALGRRDFYFHCAELSPELIDKAKAQAAEKDLVAQFTFEHADLNSYIPSAKFGAAFAHHSLHHVVELEHLFDQIAAALDKDGAFVTSDMIGRNGHMRWPETLAILQRLWEVMPKRYRYHHQLREWWFSYPNWDNSTVGFEGIRAQDIMPALIERFEFTHLCAWGGILDDFVGRGLGPNFEWGYPEDREFIERLWAAEAALLRARCITPTHLVAVMRQKGMADGLRASFDLTPAACVRRP